MHFAILITFAAPSHPVLNHCFSAHSSNALLTRLTVPVREAIVDRALLNYAVADELITAIFIFLAFFARTSLKGSIALLTPETICIELAISVIAGHISRHHYLRARALMRHSIALLA